MSEIQWATEEEKDEQNEKEISDEWEEWFTNLPLVSESGD